MYNITKLKILVIGPEASGKTTIVNYLAEKQNVLENPYRPTAGVRIIEHQTYVDNRKVSTDVLGRQRTIGTMKYIPGTSTNGTADISAIYKGISFKIEVKIGKDKQSEAQKKYQQEVERAGAVYIIAKDFDNFIIDFKNEIINRK